jgi:tetratricopeptide (TPR) repeat protein
MSHSLSGTRAVDGDRPPPTRLVEQIKARFEAEDLIRRGVCLLNAGQYEEAERVFAEVASSGCTDVPLPCYLAACLLGRNEPDGAAQQFAKLVEPRENGSAARIRYALARWSAGDFEDALHSLREGIRANPEDAELHFQLGALLSGQGCFDEAELRFTQAINIDRRHAEAHVNFALCRGAQEDPGGALAHLRQAQALKPWDARIGLLLAQAAKAASEQGIPPSGQVQMPEPSAETEEEGVDELSRIIAGEPDFVDAFLALPEDKVDSRVFASLLAALTNALAQHPEHAEVHYHRGRVLARLGRQEDAITANERAVQIEPTFTRALIELAKLYQQTDRTNDAVTRLEQAVAAGAEYADVYFLLGNLYRRQGHITKARSAYKRALLINNRYEAALTALEALPVM